MKHNIMINVLKKFVTVVYNKLFKNNYVKTSNIKICPYIQYDIL